MKLALFVNLYPAVSLTFIRREIAALEAAGVEVMRVSLRADPRLVDAEDQAEAARTLALLQAGAVRLLGLALGGILAAPLRFAATLGFAWRLAGRCGVGRAKMLAYLVEAAALARATRGCDMVRVHFGTNGAVVARLARRLGGAPYVVAYHGPNEFDAPERWDLGGTIGEAAFVTAITHYCASQLMRWSDPADWPRIHVVRCGIDDRFLPDTAPSFPPRPTRLCAVARLSAQKGLPLLVDAFAADCAAGGDAQLDLVGDGELRAELEARVRAAGLGDRVTFHGSQPGEAVRRLVGGAHALILPSFAEGLPVVAMEAMGLGRPVLASAIAGIPELVVPGETGWLVPAGDAAALAEGLATVRATDEATLSAMGARARDAVRRRHSVAQEAATLHALLRDWLGGDASCAA